MDTLSHSNTDSDAFSYCHPNGYTHSHAYTHPYTVADAYPSGIGNHP